MRKISLILLIIISPIILGSCAKKVGTDTNKTPAVYHYENKDLGFQIDLPAQFEYFQTQRIKGDGFVDLEIFVPTSDTAYPQEVKGYAKPIVIRVYEKSVWDKQGSNDRKDGFNKIGQSDRVYAVKFWQTTPKDWLNIWNENYKDNLINLIKIY
jgi:hypothetical protein